MLSWHPLKNGQPNQYHSGFCYLASRELDDSYHFAYLCKAITQHVWSPIVFRGNVRAEKNFKGTVICALDFDAPETTLSWALETFKDFEHIIGTTKSHQREKNGVTCDRFRVVLFYDGIITDLAQYKHNMQVVVTKYRADKACKDGARFFYPCKEIISTGNGAFVKIEPLPVVPQEKEQTKYRQVPAHFVIRDTPAPIGERNVYVFAAACEMIRRGMTPKMHMGTIRNIANGLDEKEIEKILENAEKAEKNPLKRVGRQGGDTSNQRKEY